MMITLSNKPYARRINPPEASPSPTHNISFITPLSLLNINSLSLSKSLCFYSFKPLFSISFVFMASYPSFLISFTILMIMHVSLSSSEVMYLPLTHSLSKTQFTTTHHLLKSTSTRSLARFHHHRHNNRQDHHQVSLPLSPGSDYTLSLSLGSKPSQTISLYMDTGSDLVWFPCSPFECILCEGEYNSSTIKATNFNLSSSSSVSCQSPSCSAAHSSLPNSDLCAISRCSLDSIETSDCSSFSCPPFYYAYADGSLIARLYHDKLSISTSSPSLVLKNFTFGCAHTALAEPIGVAGFGHGDLSLPAQLASFSPQLGNQFSYCLVSHSFNADRVRVPSPLILGRHSVDEEEADKSKRVDNNGGEFVYTAMLDNPKHPYFYSVGLEGITVGKMKIPSPEAMKKVDRSGNGGMVVDSGTTYTMLPASFYNSVVTEFDRRVGRVNKRASEIEDKTGLSPCYYFDNDESSDHKVGKVPAVVLHFVENSSVVLPRRNYFYDFFDGGDVVGKKRKVGCLMLMNGGDEAESSGPSATLGNYQQQGFEVVYDLEKRRVGFAKRKCSSLWGSLNRR